MGKAKDKPAKEKAPAKAKAPAATKPEKKAAASTGEPATKKASKFLMRA